MHDLGLNELVSNAYKYTFANNQEGLLSVSVERIETGKYQLTIADNGKGLLVNSDVRKAKSLGLRLVRWLIKQLYGTVTYTGGQGARFVVIFKGTIESKAV